MAKKTDVVHGKGGEHGKGHAKGKVRVPLCVPTDDGAGYVLKLVPSVSVNGRIEEDGAVYPLADGTCPLLPPVVSEEEAGEEIVE